MYSIKGKHQRSSEGSDQKVPKEVIKTVTVETASPISYAAIGISVVILVIAGVLSTRRKTE